MAAHGRAQQRDHVALAVLDEPPVQLTAEVANQQRIGQWKPAKAEQAEQQLLSFGPGGLQLTGDRHQPCSQQTQMSAGPTRHSRAAQRLALDQRQKVRPLVEKLEEIPNHDFQRVVNLSRQ